jgi:hypothetical protein
VDWALREIFARLTTNQQNQTLEGNLPVCENDAKFEEVLMVLLGETEEVAERKEPKIIANCVGGITASQNLDCMCFSCMHNRGETRPQGKPVDVITQLQAVMGYKYVRKVDGCEWLRMDICGGVRTQVVLFTSKQKLNFFILQDSQGSDETFVLA